MIQKRCNIVTFRLKFVPADSPPPKPGRRGKNELTLKLDSTWQINAGIKPDINSAVVTFKEFDKLWISQSPTTLAAKVTSEPPTSPAPEPPGGDPEPGPTTPEPTPLRTEGDICFYFTSETTPDVVIENVTLVDAQVLEWGKIKVDTPEPSIPVMSPIKWRIWFADFRHRAAPDRTGRLTQGLVNPVASKEEFTEPNPPAPTIRSNKELIELCLAAIGAAFWSCPESVNKHATARNLDWYGAIPQTELDALLTHTHHVFCPVSDPMKWVQENGSGDEPIIPLDRLIVEWEIPLLRPGKTVVITSAPTPVIESYKSGGSADQPNWDFVLQDTDKIWRRLPLLSVFDGVTYGGDPLAAFRDSYRQFFPDVRRDLYDFAYKYLQLDPERFPPDKCPLVRKRVSYNPNSVGEPVYEFHDIYVTATVAQPLVGQFGGWLNTSKALQVPVNYLVGPNVIYCATRLGRVAGNEAQAELEPTFFPSDDIRVEFSVESWDEDRGRKRYFVAGWRRELGEIKQLSEAEAQALFDAGGDESTGLIVHQMPELQYIKPDGDEDPALRAKLIEMARVKATALLAERAVTPKEVHIVGFYPVEISGKVSRIEYDQENLKTRYYVDSFARVGAAESKKAAQEQGRFPGDNRTRQQRTYLGQSGQVQPSVTALPAPQVNSSGNLIEFQITGAGPGDREYLARTVRGGVAAGADDVIALNLWDKPGERALIEPPIQNTNFIGLIQGTKESKAFVRFCGVDVKECA